jgi:REP element-mobilizing transposase RayT
MDRMLDRQVCGPVFLQRPELARLVLQAVKDGQVRFHRYDLHAFVIMPNHVHLLATPHVTARYWLGPLKGFTAHEANRMLAVRARSGKTRAMTIWFEMARSSTASERISSRIR